MPICGLSHTSCCGSVGVTCNQWKSPVSLVRSALPSARGQVRGRALPCTCPLADERPTICRLADERPLIKPIIVALPFIL